uniref:ZP domain-containing protein n=1 Tax=Acrobeloides nanus TaxID=290746 RepID=A0A914C7E9_9BILA
MEPDEIVTNSFEVSGLPTTEIQDEMHMPTCDYSVKSGSIHGPPSTFANVGETVFHVWECKGNDMGMLVKKCFVTDGEGEDRAVIDFDGCSTDTSLLSQVTYDESLMRAHAQSQVFKYADSNQLYFTCQIRLCQKQMGMCEGITPPDCGSRRNTTSARRKRALLINEHEDFEVDVATPEMLILSRDELLQLGKTEFLVFFAI